MCVPSFVSSEKKHMVIKMKHRYIFVRKKLTYIKKPEVLELYLAEEPIIGEFIIAFTIILANYSLVQPNYVPFRPINRINKWLFDQLPEM